MAQRASPHPEPGAPYLCTQGRVQLTGLQALVRLPLEQVLRDRRAGRRVGALISGYPGSPLAGLDREIERNRSRLERDQVHFVPGLNEELAAGAVAGTQLIDLFPHSKFDGALGLWYGKAPGLDRSLDVLRHANFVGTGRCGGALAVVGDDPSCKSSSLPSHSEHAFAHAMIPLLAPADAGDVLRLGLHGFALSRFAGLWAGLKIVADVADGGAILDLPLGEDPPQLPKLLLEGVAFRKRLEPLLLPPHVSGTEERILYERLEAVRLYAYQNGLNPILRRHPRDRIGLIASGQLYRELETALDLLGLDDAELARLGLRLMKLELLYPLEPRRLAEFADGLDEVIVIDARRGFIEDQVRAALFNQIDHPFVLGQRDEAGRPWIARHAKVWAQTLALDLGLHLAEKLDCAELRTRTDRLRSRSQSRSRLRTSARSPVFCSGCPHSASTRLPEGAVAGGGIGCHTMALLMDRKVPFIGAMGAEGSAWIGLAPFVDTPHIFQNLGDGTYFHSGRQAVRACVEAGATLTFKLLYNGTIAMTGGQDAVGAKPLVNVVRDLLSDGVRRIIAMSEDPALRRLARSSPALECIDRGAYDGAMVQLQQQPGVSVLIYDEVCANQKQRLERRGILPRPDRRIVINEDVCEGCGDCGAKSSCISLRPVSTPLGRRTRIHEASCSDDRTCIQGDCPAFMSLPRRSDPRPLSERWVPETPPAAAEPEWTDERFQILLIGVGSTGVVSTDAILMRAAELDGLWAIHLDQTGLAQRGGKVVSHCILGRRPLTGSPRVTPGGADVLLGLDPLSSTEEDSLAYLDRGRTRAVVHEVLFPTGAMLASPDSALPDLTEIVSELRRQTRSLFALRAEALAEAALGEPLAANLVLLGAALQEGLLPLSTGAVEQAIRDRGVAVETNLRALLLGRCVAHEPGLADQLLVDAEPRSIGDGASSEQAAQRLGSAWQDLEAALPTAAGEPERSSPLHRIAGFALDLVDYQSPAYARSYLRTLSEVVRAEVACGGTSLELTRTVARELYRLMAYKDEYEVARLLLRGPHRSWLERGQGGKTGIRYHLHPPLLRALGLGRKLACPSAWVDPLLRTLVKLRRLRGTPLDPFGFARVRRLERELVSWYRALLRRLCTQLDPEILPRVIEIAATPGRIRGFETLKTERAQQARALAEDLLSELEARSSSDCTAPPRSADSRTG